MLYAYLCALGMPVYPWFELRYLLNAVSVIIVPAAAPDLSRK